MRTGVLTRIEKSIWASPAGKQRLAPRLVKMIPAHKVYVEPFAGSGALFYRKPPVAKEVLSDVDPEIASAYRTLSRLTDSQLAQLRQRSWTGSREMWSLLQRSSPQDKLEKLYRFLYLSHFSFGKLRGKSFDPATEGVAARTIARIERHRDRLRGVTIRAGHYADVVKEFDGPDTFHFLDPPYVGANVLVGEDRFDEDEFRRVLDGIRGKFLVTYGTSGRLNTKGYVVKHVRTPRTIARLRASSGPKMLHQLLISNYQIAAKSMDPWQLEDVASTIDLPAPAAAALDYGTALALALAEESLDPDLIELAKCMQSHEDLSGGRVQVLAAALLPWLDRMSPHAVELPDLSTAVARARPSIIRHAGSGGVATTNTTRALLNKQIPILKTLEERFVLGVVLEPETVDAQQDIYSADEVRAAAHRFMEEFQNIGLMHQGLINQQVKLLESYLAPVDFEVDGERVLKGTWLLALRIVDDELWGEVKSGGLTGLSIGGTARREDSPELQAS